MVPLLVVLSVLGAKDAIEDIQRHQMDRKINDHPTEVHNQ